VLPQVAGPNNLDIVEIEHMIVEFVLNSFQCPDNMSRRGCKTSFMATNRNKPRHHRASNPFVSHDQGYSAITTLVFYTAAENDGIIWGLTPNKETVNNICNGMQQTRSLSSRTCFILHLDLT